MNFRVQSKNNNHFPLKWYSVSRPGFADLMRTAQLHEIYALNQTQIFVVEVSSAFRFNVNIARKIIFLSTDL